MGFVAAQELVLFVFVMSMVLAGALIQSKRLGVTRRMMATTATTAEVVAGEGLGRYLVAVVQSAVIIASTAVFFGLDWGSWPATLAIVGLVLSGGHRSCPPHRCSVGVRNKSQSQAVGISVGLALAALGGCMVPSRCSPRACELLPTSRLTHGRSTHSPRWSSTVAVSHRSAPNSQYWSFTGSWCWWLRPSCSVARSWPEPPAVRGRVAAASTFRSARPVSWRKTSSRSGSFTCTDSTLAPASLASARISGRTV